MIRVNVVPFIDAVRQNVLQRISHSDNVSALKWSNSLQKYLPLETVCRSEVLTSRLS